MRASSSSAAAPGGSIVPPSSAQQQQQYRGGTLAGGGLGNMAEVVDPRTPSQRWSVSERALGGIRRRILFNRYTLYCSPDQATWLVPTILTVILAGGAWFTVGDVVPWYERLLYLGFLGTAFGASFAVTCTDPGVYPRLEEDEKDPLLGDAGGLYRHCNYCKLKRPPRTAHCHVCDVCVLEHDHHCGVLGGCVGMRSLRWFALYLVSVSFAACMAFWWLVSAMWFATAGANNATARRSLSQRRGRRGDVMPIANSETAAHIVLMIFIGNVILLVGGLACYYVWLVMTDTTRREAQGKRYDGAYKGSSETRGILGNIWRACNPPPSMLELPPATATSGSGGSGSEVAWFV